MDKLDYKGLYNLALQKNIKQLQKEIDTEQTKTKIHNWAKKFQLNPLEVRQKIIDDNMFSLHYIIEPARQGFHEKLAADYIKKFSNVSNFENLPTSGKNALVVHSGLIVPKEESPSNAGKTVDFKWDTDGYKCYASHKYTKDGGGAQDNQYKDLRDFMKNSRQNNDVNIRFFAICDGEYYQHKDSNGYTKIEILNRDFDKKDKLIALSIDDLFNYLETKIRKKP
jgi:hypothetical protein